jgi:F0F1-type ATP synthase membrane subunit c/vacuolar-type H+-ATPase subunit K
VGTDSAVGIGGLLLAGIGLAIAVLGTAVTVSASSGAVLQAARQNSKMNRVGNGRFFIFTLHHKQVSTKHTPSGFGSREKILMKRLKQCVSPNRVDLVLMNA